MIRLRRAIHAALAAFIASWREVAPAPALVSSAAQAASPYRESHKLPCKACGETANLTRSANQQKEATLQTRGIQCSCGCGHSVPWNPTPPPSSPRTQPPPRTVSEKDWRRFKAWERTESERGLQVTPGGRYQATITAEEFAAEKKRLDDWRRDDAGLMARTYPPPGTDQT